MHIKYLPNLLRIEWRRRKSKKRGGKLKLKLGDVAGFFHELHKANISYVVLRWFDEVPLDPLAEKEATKDVDMLFDHHDLKELVQIGIRFPGPVLAEFYSVSGKKGTSARGYPYYPPVLAEEILSGRILHKDSFYIPSPFHHFQSLCYHLVYHKGFDSGLPINDSTPPKAAGKRDYPALLKALAEAEGITLEEPLTLEGLNHHLIESDWAMPYDLKLRWRFCEKEWMQQLSRAEEASDFTFSEKIPGLIIFLIRSDGSDSPEIKEATIEEINRHFTTIDIFELDSKSQHRVIRNVRGGNWLEHRKKVLIPPTHALVCFDPAPKLFSEDHAEHGKRPLVTNENILNKHSIRDQVNQRFPSEGSKRIVLHSSDNAMEAHHHLFHVLGRERYHEYCEELVRLKKIPN